MLTDRIKVNADVAHLPYVNFNGLDTHEGLISVGNKTLKHCPCIPIFKSVV